MTITCERPNTHVIDVRDARRPEPIDADPQVHAGLSAAGEPRSRRRSPRRTIAVVGAALCACAGLGVGVTLSTGSSAGTSATVPSHLRPGPPPEITPLTGSGTGTATFRLCEPTSNSLANDNPLWSLTHFWCVGSAAGTGR